ncbi:MAG TPA: hypothetical protein VKY89_00045 [Thermoanaerobaculia bacterium]|nr:hypothetical protein [Thermoanaerobaculia bacterium]
MKSSVWKRLALVVAGLLAAELAAQLGMAVLGQGRAAAAAARDGILVSAARDGETAAAGAGSATAATPPPSPPSAAVRAEAASSQIVLQPYLGYVIDPEINGWRSRIASGAPRITDDGFYAMPGPAATGGPDEVEVGLFGGSVALLLCFEGRDALLAELARYPGFSNKRLVLHCFAVGGYKQPQQLMALGYLLALGRKLDLVINLDGFNDVALPFRENRPAGVFPFYPRGWNTLVEGVPDLARLRLVGAIVDLEDRRVRLARGFSGLPWRYSAVANLCWQVLDQGLEARLGEAQAALQQAGSGGRGRFLGHGPRRDYRGDDDFFADLAATWRRSSLAMAHLCGGAGIRYYHFLQPNQYDPGAKPMSAAERRTAYKPDHPYRTSVEKGYPLLAAAGRELAAAGVRYYDARQVFAGIAEPLYVDQCCHVSAKGSQILGAWMAARIVEDLRGPAATGRRRPSRDKKDDGSAATRKMTAQPRQEDDGPAATRKMTAQPRPAGDAPAAAGR